MKQFRLALIGLALSGSVPAIAAASEGTITRMISGTSTGQLLPDERATYRTALAAIRSGDWASAGAALDARPDGLLTPVVRAELYLAKGSPKVETSALASLVAQAPDLPQSIALARLARGRGAVDLAPLPAQHDLVRFAGASKRVVARPGRSDAAAAALAQAVQPLLKADQPAAAEALVDAASATLSPDALTEWRQKVAWGFYQAGDDAGARRVATIGQGGSGEWVTQAAWVGGLAAWRAKDCAAASDAFAAVAARAKDSETIAAGLFWAARADMACQRPERVQPRLRTAARLDETFYGMLAAEMLAMPAPDVPTVQLALASTDRIADLPNVRRAVALAEIGETALADQLLRQQARIGTVGDHEALLSLAARLNLPATQIWLAQNGPSGARLSASARYPTPAWSPASGWRVDKALLFAHALQESQFRADAVSPAGARGLMQIMPGTAQLIAKKRGEIANPGRLTDPAYSLEYSQYYLQDLADRGGTGGLLPKVIAAYNAGPGRIVDWNAKGRGLDDPLLFIESIPYAETRGYVTTVLRNYWMYQRQAGVAAVSCRAMAQGLWPRFPGMPGKTALRIDTTGQLSGAD